MSETANAEMKSPTHRAQAQKQWGIQSEKDSRLPFDLEWLRQIEGQVGFGRENDLFVAGEG